jgi:hypothetical protein
LSRPQEDLTIGIHFSREKEIAALNEFGIRWLCDPRKQMHFTDDPWKLSNSLNARYTDAIMTSDAKNEFNYTLRGSRFQIMRIDLLIDGPIDTQIDFVRWLLKRAKRASLIDQIKPPRIQRDLFSRYLRLLDARSDGAS